MNKIILMILVLLMMPQAFALTEIEPVAYDCKNSVLCYNIDTTISCVTTTTQISECKEKVVVSDTTLVSPLRKTLEIGMIILVVVLIIIALIVVFTKNYKNDDDEEDDEENAQTYY